MKLHPISSADLTASLSVSFLTVAAGAALGEWTGIGAFAGIISMAGASVVGSVFGGIPVKVSGLSAITGALYISILANTALTSESIVWAMLVASLALFIAGWYRAARIMQYIPNTVIAGFINGVAILLIYKQLQKIFSNGLVFENLNTESYIALATVVLLLAWRYISAQPMLHKVGGIISGSLLAMVLGGTAQYWYQFDVGTLSVTLSSLSEIITIPSLDVFLANAGVILIQGLMIAFIVLVATLITARALDPDADYDAELKNQSLTNLFAGLVGGFPTTLGFIRTVILKRNQASSVWAGIFVGIWTLAIVFFLTGLLTFIPTSVFTGILLIAGYRAIDTTIFKEHTHNQHYYAGLAIFFLVAYLTFIGQLAVAVILGSALWQLCIWLPKLHMKDLSKHTPGVTIGD
ncbi:SulP family inorganic anion transporter [Candidatus Pacebacteria bacterium]|nr:SulP family inorganic anion transporter [Candidatus Paceibacterota bacterium]